MNRREDEIIALIQEANNEKVFNEMRVEELFIDIDELFFVLENRFGVLYDNTTELKTVGDIVNYFANN